MIYNYNKYNATKKNIRRPLFCLRSIFAPLLSGGVGGGLLLAVLISCSYDEEVQLCPVSVELVYQQTSFAEPEAARVRVELKDSHGSIFVDSTDTKKKAHFLVTPGIYEAKTSSNYIDSVSSSTWWRYMFNGTKSLIVVSPDSTNDIELNVTVSRKRQVH